MFVDTKREGADITFTKNNRRHTNNNDKDMKHACDQEILKTNTITKALVGSVLKKRTNTLCGTAYLFKR